MALRPGAVTAVLVDRPNGAPHIVLVERGMDGGFVLVETQHHGDGRLVRFELDRSFNPEDGLAGLPPSLRAPVRLVRDAAGGLGQLEPVDRRVRPFQVVAAPGPREVDYHHYELHPNPGSEYGRFDQRVRFLVDWPDCRRSRGRSCRCG